MPELPDLTLYLEALERVAVGRRLELVRFADPFVLRTAEPPISEVINKLLLEVRRIGKRIIFVLETTCIS